MPKQQTLKQPLKIEGIGLHSGCKAVMNIHPAPENFGIVFKRVDLEGQPELKGLYSQIVDTRNCSCLGDKSGNHVSTIEHLMGALCMKGVDNALIEINNPEIPIMDGSAKVFADIFKNVELVEQNAPRRYLKVKKEVVFADDKGNTVSLAPSDKLHIHFEIDFPSKIVGHQEFDADIDDKVFAEKIAPSRTFCEKYQVDYLQSIGLIKGGSLENAVVLDGENILNEGGFRVPNECVNHKVLDAIGDLYTSGYHVLGKLTAAKTGHFHTNELLKKLFADKSNYEIVEEI